MATTDRRGTGDWDHWPFPMEKIYEAAGDWEQQLRGVEKPWLCWNMSPRWSLVQQNLVRSVGWTPVVGSDPRVERPPLATGSIYIDFNQRFQFGEMRFHFVIEWAFLFAPRLAFWHSDLLCRLPIMQQLVQTFESLQDGEMAAVKEERGWKERLKPRSKRYWELVGCTTRGASRSQFEKGSGWWRNFAHHPNCKDANERTKRETYFYEFGVGIMYWKQNYEGKVREIAQPPLDEGHCTGINRKNYVHLTQDKGRTQKYAELDLNFDIEEVVSRLEISQFLPPLQHA